MIVEDIMRVYNKTQSIKATASETGCSWQRVVKILSSNGVIINETHELILKLHDEGKTPEEIARQTGRNVKVIKAYIPGKRPYYNVAPSENAQKIKKCREKKKESISDK